MPLRMEKAGRIVPTIRVSEDRKHCMLMLVNGSMDPQENVRVAVNLPIEGPWMVLDKHGNKSLVPDHWVQTADGKTTLCIDYMNPWEYLVLLA